jgi:hypothetical protein
VHEREVADAGAAAAALGGQRKQLQQAIDDVKAASARA